MKIPVLPIRDRVVFPHIQVPLVVGRQRSIQAIQTAFRSDQVVFVVAQRHAKVEEPTREDLYEFGVVAEILQSVSLPDGLLRVRVLGKYRARLQDLTLGEGVLMGDVFSLEAKPGKPQSSMEMEALRRMVIRQFEQYVKKLGRISADVSGRIVQLKSLDDLADSVADVLLISLQDKQDLIELADVSKRLKRLVEILDAENEILGLERRIQSRVHKQIEKNQREYYLGEQMRAIQKELKKKDEFGQELDDLRGKIKEAMMGAEAEEVALKEVGRLEKMMPYSPEATVVRSYLDWLMSMPWTKGTPDHLDVRKARELLEEDHFGLEKPKERLLEYLAVLRLTHSIKGPILCFVGPPGTGKTSIVKSMARAMGRKFMRISLGGVRDEAEIRGHRRTYIGALPGRIVRTLRKVKSKNPIILLDEIDKMGSDWRGDPGSALLEVLDPEQNKSFVDHYLDVPINLSEIIFIATANSLYGIPHTLLDRLEVIRFSAYITDEKVAIAHRFLIPKECQEHGLPAASLRLEEEALRKMIHSYTQEAGVRGLQRKIAQVCRKVAVDWVEKKRRSKSLKTISIGLGDLAHYLGIPEFTKEKVTVNAVGIATGLAWTDHGGEVLTIEVTTVPGSGKILLTGKLGEVMKESAHTAFSLVKSKAAKLNLRSALFRKSDLHIHVPEGAVPKDGPSAGIAIATAIVSALTGRAVIKDLAMTGEVTLRGRVLPIGGLKEKVIAGFREEIKVILYPEANEKDLPDIPENVRQGVRLVPVKSIDEVLLSALQPAPLKTVFPQRKASHIPRPS